MSRQLSARREAFCQQFVVHRDASRAYRAAGFGLGNGLSTTVAPLASHLLAKPPIRARISEIDRRSAETWDISKIREILVGVITADPNELTSIRVGCCRYCYGIGHAYQWKEREYIEELDKAERHNKFAPIEKQKPLPDPAGGFDFDFTREPSKSCPDCRGKGVTRYEAADTTQLGPGGRFLYNGVKKTKDGLEVLTMDRTKAVDMLTRIMGGYEDRVRVRHEGRVDSLNYHIHATDPLEAARAYTALIEGNGED